MVKNRNTTPGERLLALIRPGNRDERPGGDIGDKAGNAPIPEDRPLFPPREVSGTAPVTAPDTAPDTVLAPTVETGPAPERTPPEDQGLFATMEPLDGTETTAGAETPGAATAPSPADGPGAGTPERVTPEPASRRRLRLGFGAKVHVGVDISKTHLVCVKTRGQDADYEILGTVVQSLPEGADPGSPNFVDILRRTLTDLCGSGPVPHIWAASQTARVNVQFVSIPKVGSRQVDNAVYWTAKKEMGFDEGTSIFDFERRGELEEKGAPRLGVLAYTAERDGVRQIRDAFVQAGFPLEGLTMEPFSHQNLFRRHCIPPNGGATAVLHVGQNWSRLEIGNKNNLLFVRVIKTSMAGMEQAVQDALESHGSARPPRAPEPEPQMPEPAALTPEPPVPAAPVASGESVVDLEQLDFSDINLKLELDVPLEPVAPPPPTPAPAPVAGVSRTVNPAQAREVLRCLVYGCDDLDETHPGWGLADDDIIAMLDPAASRLVRQVEMTLKHFRESLGFEGVTRLAVSGLLGASKAFVAYMSAQLGLPCMALDPVGSYLARGRDVPGIDAPGMAYTQALGLALSDNAITPNLLRTYREKAASRAARALEQWSLVGLAVVLAGLAFVSLDARWNTQGLQAERQAVSRQLQALGGKVNLDGLTHRVEAMQRRRAALRTSLARVRTLGVWGEALSLAPEGMGLGTLRVDFGPPEGGAPQKAAKPKSAGNKPGTTGRLVLEGMISGDGRLFDSKLASYVVALEHSPLFTAVTVQKSELEALEGGASGLHFVIALSLVEN